MAQFGFRIVSGGVGPISASNLYIAYSSHHCNCGLERNLFRIGNMFNYTTTLALGYTMSAVDGGFSLPPKDTSDRALPNNWIGLRLRLEVAGGHYPAVSTQTEVKLTLSKYDTDKREITLYEDTFNMLVRGTNVGGINIEGNLDRCDLTFLNHSSVYSSIMHPFDWRRRDHPKSHTHPMPPWPVIPPG